MARFKRIARKVFCLPPLPTALIAVPAFALVIFSLSTQAGGPVAYVSYAASAYALVLVCTSLPRLGKRIKAFRERAVRRPAVQKLMNVPVLDRYFHDVRFKTKVSLYRGLFINLLYIAVKLAAGVYYRSFWFISLAIYYALLALMRLLLLRRAKEKTGRAPMMEELHRYRLCGIMLLVMNQALTGIVVYLVHLDRSFHYPGYLIYAMALYSFYAIITAAVNVVRYRKHGSPVLSAAKAINLVAAMVSILALTTAMLSQFGENDTSSFRQAMTAAVGGGICTIVIGMAVYMIWNATRQMKKPRINNS